MNLIRHLAIKHNLILIVTHLVKLFIPELTLTLGAHKCHSGLPHQNTVISRVVYLVQEVLFGLAGRDCFLGHAMFL